MAIVPTEIRRERVTHHTVSKVTSSRDVTAVGGTLARAFFNDPVMTWAFPDPDRRRLNAPGVFELYAEAFAPHGETYMTAGATGAALWLPPGRALFHDEGSESLFATQVEERAGADASRLFELMAALDANHPEGSFYVLQLLGVEPQWQGQGVGSALMATVLTRCDLERVPAYLEATSASSQRLYQRHGFTTIGEISLPGGPPLFRMWREPVRARPARRPGHRTARPGGLNPSSSRRPRKAVPALTPS